MSVIARHERQPVDEEEDDAAEDQHDADQRQRFEQHAGDEVVEQDADDRRRQEGDEDAEDEAPGPAGRVGRSVREVPEPAGIDREEREDRAELDQHLEGLAGVLEAEELAEPGGDGPSTRPAGTRSRPRQRRGSRASMIDLEVHARSPSARRPNRLVPAAGGFYTPKLVPGLRFDCPDDRPEPRPDPPA